MSDKKDGGPAFPTFQATGINADTIRDGGGLTMRDYFAAAALTGLLADSLSRPENPLQTFTERAYEYADSMIAQRDK